MSCSSERKQSPGLLLQASGMSCNTLWTSLQTRERAYKWNPLFSLKSNLIEFTEMNESCNYILHLWPPSYSCSSFKIPALRCAGNHFIRWRWQYKHLKLCGVWIDKMGRMWFGVFENELKTVLIFFSSFNLFHTPFNLVRSHSSCQNTKITCC